MTNVTGHLTPFVVTRSERNPDRIRWIPTYEADKYVRAGWHKLTDKEVADLRNRRYGRMKLPCGYSR